jgi:hypothetical protein
MKPNQLKSATLSLNKKSISNLNNCEMGRINGGMVNNTTRPMEVQLLNECTRLCPSPPFTTNCNFQFTDFCTI